MSTRRPPLRRGGVRAATADMLPGKDSSQAVQRRCLGPLAERPRSSGGPRSPSTCNRPVCLSGSGEHSVRSSTCPEARASRWRDTRFFWSWADVRVTWVSGDMRTYEPSGNWIAAWPPPPACTVSLGLSASPAMPGFPLTSTGWLIRRGRPVRRWPPRPGQRKSSSHFRPRATTQRRPRAGSRHPRTRSRGRSNLPSGGSSGESLAAGPLARAAAGWPFAGEG